LEDDHFTRVFKKFSNVAQFFGNLPVLLAQHSLQTSQKLQQAIPNPSANNGQLVIMSEAPTSKFMQVQGLVDSGDFEHFEPPPFAAMPPY
jgi:hypothetical protein